jgi:Icc-related predicted phosphoesterase
MLDLQKSSARRRFLRHLKGYKEDYEIERQEIIKELAEKEANGAVKVVNEVVQYTKENRKKADAKFELLNKMEIPVDWSGENQDRDTVISILKEKVAEFTKDVEVVDEKGKKTGEQKPREYSDGMIVFLEQLQELIEEINK